MTDAVRFHPQHLLHLPPSALAIHPRNARDHDVGAIHESIVQNGFFGGVFAWQHSEDLFGEPVPYGKHWVLAGAGRLTRLVEAGASTIPTILVDCSREDAEGFFLADNATTDEASYHDEKLLHLLSARVQQQQKESIDAALRGTGYTAEKMSDLADRIRLAHGHVSAVQKPKAEEAPKAREEDGTVRFRFGSFEGKCSADVYDDFVARYNAIRGSQFEHHDLLDDVLRAWLDLSARE